MICIGMKAAKGMLYRPAWQKKLICELSTLLVKISLFTQPYSIRNRSNNIKIDIVSAENYNSKINIFC
jgi:hypothetical protein